MRINFGFSPWKGAFLAGLVCISFLGCSGLPQRDQRSAELHMQVGTGYLSQRDYPRALQELEIAAKLDPENPLVQDNLGLALFFRERYDLAEVAFRKALKISPKFNDARNNLARDLIERAKYGEAISELKKITADLTYPYPDRTYTHLGLAYFRRGDFSEARAQLSEALRLNRENCLAQTLYGRSQMEAGEVKASAESLDHAVEICKDPDFDEPYYFAGMAYLKLGDTGKAIARLEDCLKKFPHGRYALRAQSSLDKTK